MRGRNGRRFELAPRLVQRDQVSGKRLDKRPTRFAGGRFIKNRELSARPDRRFEKIDEDPLADDDNGRNRV